MYEGKTKTAGLDHLIGWTRDALHEATRMPVEAADARAHAGLARIADGTHSAKGIAWIAEALAHMASIYDGHAEGFAECEAWDAHRAWQHATRAQRRQHERERRRRATHDAIGDAYIWHESVARFGEVMAALPETAAGRWWAEHGGQGMAPPSGLIEKAADHFAPMLPALREQAERSKADAYEYLAAAILAGWSAAEYLPAILPRQAARSWPPSRRVPVVKACARVIGRGARARSFRRQDRGPPPGDCDQDDPEGLSRSSARSRPSRAARHG